MTYRCCSASRTGSSPWTSARSSPTVNPMTSCTKTASTTNSSGAVAKGPVPTYAQAQADGTVGNYNWGPNCNTATGRVTLPGRDVSPCVPVFTGDNGGDIAPDHGVTKSTIRIARY